MVWCGCGSCGACAVFCVLYVLLCAAVPDNVDIFREKFVPSTATRNRIAKEKVCRH